MANQIVVSAGAKVRNLQDVIIGTSGVLTSLGFDVANGVPRLDVNGKILVSQLPNSVMEYKGTWNAATNTPTLANGTGNQGDVYLCNVAGTVDFGAGAIAFVVGDQVIYSGSIWQRASGATGTVTSVAITESGDSLNITGSPITTSGTINIGFNGTNLQYVNGAGNLTTFPTLITSIGLSMPSAFSVANSPLTANGTIAVTGAGVASQYIRGDGTLADFPSSGGGGSSVSYYLNGGTSQGTIGGTTYYEMSKTADTGTGVDFPKTGDGFIVAFLTDANDPAQLNIPAGNWNYEIYASMSSNGGTPQMYAELYKYDGTTFTLIATSTNEIIYDGTALNLYTFAMAVPATSLTLTDRLAVKLYATNSGGKTTTIHTQDGHLCQIITTFSTGITALNGLTAQVQYFQTGTSGTDFNISSTTATHTFNLPTASATNRGALSSADWTTFNNKQSALTNPITGTGTSGQVAYFNGTSSLTSNAAFAFTPTSQLLVNNSVTAASAIARGTNLTPTLTAAANGDVLVGLDITPTFANGAFTGVSNIALRINGTTTTSFLSNGNILINQATDYGHKVAINSGAGSALRVDANSGFTALSIGGTGILSVDSASSGGRFIITSAGFVGINNNSPSVLLDVNGSTKIQGGASTALRLDANSNVDALSIGGVGRFSVDSGVAGGRFRIFTNGNTTINQNTDAGYKLDVNGTARVQGAMTISTGGFSVTGNSTLNGDLSMPGYAINNLYSVNITNAPNGGGLTLRGSLATNTLAINFQESTTNVSQINWDNTNNYLQLRAIKANSVINFTVTGNTISTISSTGVSINGNLITGGTSVNASAQLQIDSTTKGFLPPRLTTTQRTAISSPAEGLIVVQTDGTQGLYLYIGAAWHSITML
jgi:hypothetical protein